MATDELLQLLQQQIQQQQLMMRAQEKRRQEQIQVLLTLAQKSEGEGTVNSFTTALPSFSAFNSELNCGRITGRGSIHLPRHIRFRAKKGICVFD